MKMYQQIIDDFNKNFAKYFDEERIKANISNEKITFCATHVSEDDKTSYISVIYDKKTLEKYITHQTFHARSIAPYVITEEELADICNL